MRYFLPPAEEPVPRTIHGVTSVGATTRASAHPEPEVAGPGEGRLIRSVTLAAAEARAHLARWESEAPAHDVPAPRGILARERSRTDRVRAGIVRRQRLAIAVAGDVATATHWSVPEPPTAEDERAWARVLARLDATALGGWRA
jgi:hypothetical protein